MTRSSYTDGKTLWLVRLREVVEALICEVYDDPALRRGRKNVTVREHDFCPFGWDPWINTRIRGDQLDVAKASVPCEVDQGVVVANIVDFGLAQHVIGVGLFRIEADIFLVYRTGPQQNDAQKGSEGS